MHSTTVPHTSRHHTQSIIIITAAAATSTTSLLRRRRFEVSPAPPCPHFLTFPAPLHTSSAVAQNSVLDVTLVSHVLTHACARWQVTSAVPLCSPVPLQSRFNRGWFARQRVPLCSPALHRCRVSRFAVPFFAFRFAVPLSAVTLSAVPLLHCS